MRQVITHLNPITAKVWIPSRKPSLLIRGPLERLPVPYHPECKYEPGDCAFEVSWTVRISQCRRRDGLVWLLAENIWTKKINLAGAAPSFDDAILLRSYGEIGCR